MSRHTDAPPDEPPPDSSLPTTSEAMEQARQHGSALPPDLEAELLRILLRPLASDETHRTGNHNRELELRALFGALTVETSYQLSRRLELARAGDPIAAAFRRLTFERQQRLQGFLIFARRRASQSR